MAQPDTIVDDDILTQADDARDDVQPYAAAIPLDRAAGGLLQRGASQQDIPEGLIRQLQDPSVLEDTSLYWLRTVASNAGEDSYGTLMQPDSLKNYALDAESGLPFCNSHHHDELPFGRTYAGKFFQGRGQHIARTEMDAYVPLDMDVNGVNTTQFVRAVRTGVARDVSIHFNPERVVCSIDGRNMPRTLMDLLSADPEDPTSPCRHVPGSSYVIDNKRVRALGKVHGAHCVELSPVFRGATPGAQVISPSRVLLIDERSAPAQWMLHTPSLRTAMLLAEADLLERGVALQLEEHCRGISFPDITRRMWAAGSNTGNNTGNITIVEEYAMPRTSAAATSAAESDSRGKGSPRGAPGSGEQLTPDATVEAVSPDTESPQETDPIEDELPPPVRSAPVQEPIVEPATEPQVFDPNVSFSELRTAMIETGLCKDGFDGDPISQLRVISARLEREQIWGGWGRRYREELCADIEREGVRAFGAVSWTEARPAYEGTLKRGDADELIALRKHFEHEASERLRGGRLTTDEEPKTPSNNGSRPRSKVPAAAYRS